MSSPSASISRVAAGLMLISTAACNSSADAAPKQSKATPATLMSILERANDGDTIVLSPGRYSGIAISKMTFKTPVVIDARAATIEGLQVKGVSGITFKGGDYRVPPSTGADRRGFPAYGSAVRLDKSTDITFLGGTFTGPGAREGDGAFGEGYGVTLVAGSKIEVADAEFVGLKAGVAMTRVDGFKVLRNRVLASRSDGFVFGESRNGLIENNECRGFRIRSDEHPDCIQLWSRPTSPPTSDIVIRGNKSSGNMQGIGMFNHVRNGVDDGGYDRILIENNDVQVGYPQGIALIGGRDSIVRNNRVSTFPGAKHRGSINVEQSSRCGNVIEAGAGRSGQRDQACKP